MSQNPQQVEDDIREAAVSQKMDLAASENAYLVCKKAPAGWILRSHPDLESAARDAGRFAWEGNIDVYILDSREALFSLIAVLR
jgi:hypothetical protein